MVQFDDSPPLIPVTLTDQARAQRCARGRVVLIDDDEEVLYAYAGLIELHGYACEPHPLASAFLAELTANRPRYPGPCCVLCDVSMPEMDGLTFQRELARHRNAPLILISGSSGLDEAVTGFRNGALDFLTKPIDADQLLATIARALALSGEYQAKRLQDAALVARLTTLSERELAVARLVARGQPNKRVAAMLNITERTVKFHRQHACEKLGVANLPELVRIMDAAESYAARTRALPDAESPAPRD